MSVQQFAPKVMIMKCEDQSVCCSQCSRNASSANPSHSPFRSRSGLRVFLCRCCPETSTIDSGVTYTLAITSSYCGVLLINHSLTWKTIEKTFEVHVQFSEFLLLYFHDGRGRTLTP